MLSAILIKTFPEDYSTNQMFTNNYFKKMITKTKYWQGCTLRGGGGGEGGRQGVKQFCLNNFILLIFVVAGNSIHSRGVIRIVFHSMYSVCYTLRWYSRGYTTLNTTVRLWPSIIFNALKIEPEMRKITKNANRKITQSDCDEPRAKKIFSKRNVSLESLNF